jgi:hypothetical protein
MRRFCSSILSVLVTLGTVSAYADQWAGTCSCNFNDGAVECRRTWTIFAETQRDLVQQCNSETYQKGTLKNVRRIVESNSDKVCSGERPTAKPHKAGPVVPINGLRTGRSCVSGPQGKKAQKFYCQMYDHPTLFDCDFNFNTNGSCNFMASAQMTIAEADGTYSYCWIFNSEDVGRPRNFQLLADFEN